MEDQDLSLGYMMQKPFLSHLIRFWRLENSKSWNTNKKSDQLSIFYFRDSAPRDGGYGRGGRDDYNSAPSKIILKNNKNN